MQSNILLINDDNNHQQEDYIDHKKAIFLIAFFIL